MTDAVAAIAFGLPPIIDLRMQERRRDTNVDTARVRNGELRRPLGLVVMSLAAVILLLDSGVGGMSGFLQNPAGASTIEQVVAPFLNQLLDMLLSICIFLVASYASHYLGKHPYLWTAAAVGCAVVVRELVVLVLWESMLKSAMGGPLWMLLLAEVEGYLVVLIVCLAGAWFGSRHHDAFLAKKLARIERKASPSAAATRQQVTTPNQTTPTNLPAPNARDRRLE